MHQPTYRYTDDYFFEQMDTAWQARRVKSRRAPVIVPTSHGSDDASIAPSIEMSIDAAPCRASITRRGQHAGSAARAWPNARV